MVYLEEGSYEKTVFERDCHDAGVFRDSWKSDGGHNQRRGCYLYIYLLRSRWVGRVSSDPGDRYHGRNGRRHAKFILSAVHWRLERGAGTTAAERNGKLDRGRPGSK